VGGAVTGTSANRSGEPGNWCSPEELLFEFGEEIDWVLWEGPIMTKAASTVVRVTDAGPTLLRDGAISFRDIMEYLQKG
jgi:tRNA A37 threonylcarbamoyladenosine synthetase subunit TsaC/SUA5/YrdC